MMNNSNALVIKDERKIGWLDADRPFPKGDVPIAFLDALFLLCTNPAIRLRSVQPCPLCPKETKGTQVTRNGKTIWLGSGIIRIKIKWRIYYAPDLIYHYAADHGYRPPDEFIEAVMQTRTWLHRKLRSLVFNSQ